ncbi:MAG: tRNA lysidine(34) synthetase TilS [Firmicutes bacterium]|nr:tRNA lysidine(34) synthetase TilS [Bacillota bacterium]MCM1400499.1 tRNA lysidine(34) synthetase TilS [Bacteroides sp.]
MTATAAMHPLLQKAAALIKQHQLLRPADKVIVGLSGGADSTALLVALNALGYDCIAAHCNYHLRGSESNRDQEHSASLAASVGVPFRVEQFNVQAYISEASRPMSVEMACRELRYNWFHSLARETGAAAIAVAHNAGDNAETLLHNLLRGTGLSGLRGMKPRNDRNIIRPLLRCTRAEIEQFLAATGHGHVTDSTNLQPLYTRNKIRLQVMPEMNRAVAGAAQGIETTLEQLLETDVLYHTLLDEKLRHYATTATTPVPNIALKRLADTESQASLLLFEWLRPLGVSRSMANDIVHSANTSGRTFTTPTGHTLITHRGELRIVTPEAGSATPPSIETLYRTEILPASEFTKPTSPLTACFDAAMLQEGKLSVRTWQPGDRMHPFGMKGSRKLSDIYSDAHLPLDVKHSLPLLLCGQKIIWTTGLRASAFFPVTESTEQFLHITYVGPPLF